jgi:CubicO group peptidase (beta-lactamase class C family)
VVELKADTDPAEVGFDPERLARIDRHLARYVDDGLLPGWLVTVSRHGRMVHATGYGRRDVEAALPVEHDTIWRIYSMTKPVTSVAVMMLYEQGRLQLTDPVARYIPSFTDVRVYSSGPALKPLTVPAAEPVRIWHLLTHTSGLTYGFHHAHPVDEMYRLAGFELMPERAVDLAAACDAWAGLPLVFQPGTEFNYSVATDVLGRVVEVVSGQRLDEFFAEHIFTPLGMVDTGFTAVDLDRLAALYRLHPETGAMAREDRIGVRWTKPPVMLSGGGGLASTAADYDRFIRMLLGGGELDGSRLLGPRTVRFMTRNHLPGGADMQAIGRPTSGESPVHGVGFGLGFSVVIDSARSRIMSSDGEFAWGGVASTAFWIDPVEEVTVQFFTQLIPSSAYPIRPQLRALVYAALVD